MTTINTPGICAQHVIISQDCIKGGGARGAIEEALDRIRKEYMFLEGCWTNNPDVKYHVVLTIEKPEPSTINNDSDQETKLYERPDSEVIDGIEFDGGDLGSMNPNYDSEW